VRRRIVSAEEQDAHTRWRRFLIWHPHELAAIKRRSRRRERREGKAETRERP